MLKGAPRAANTPPIAAAASFEAAAVAGVVGDVAAGALTATIRRTSSSSAIKRSSGGRKVKVALPPMASSTADSPPPAAPEGAVAPAFDQEAVQQQVSDLLMEDGGLTFSVRSYHSAASSSWLSLLLRPPIVRFGLLFLLCVV